MARKASSDAESAHGFNDVVGLVLLACAVLLLAALLSYDPHDLASNIVPPNPTARNWIGPFGAHLAHRALRWFGVAAYLLPLLLLLLGLGCFFHAFAHLRRRWLWTVILLLCCSGLLDLHQSYLRRLQTQPPGGL